MDCGNSILSEGINALRQSDGDIDTLIAPRQDVVLSLLTGYIAEIELFNPAYGLVGTKDTQELIIKHILDSLAPLGIMYRLLTARIQTANSNAVPCVADVGSGAGLPGIPLAITLPQVNFTLIERMGRRAGFLRNTQATLGLANITVAEGEMEKIGRKPTMTSRFSLVVFRAFRPLDPKILKGLFRFCGTGGILMAYKGRREKIEEEITVVQKRLPNINNRWELIPCPVPFLEGERHLLIIKPGTDRVC
jgi:16S rRNA (guanine527-N7)-methyltransferase